MSLAGMGGGIANKLTGGAAEYTGYVESPAAVTVGSNPYTLNTSTWSDIPFSSGNAISLDSGVEKRYIEIRIGGSKGGYGNGEPSTGSPYGGLAGAEIFMEPGSSLYVITSGLGGGGGARSGGNGIYLGTVNSLQNTTDRPGSTILGAGGGGGDAVRNPQGGVRWGAGGAGGGPTGGGIGGTQTTGGPGTNGGQSGSSWTGGSGNPSGEISSGGGGGGWYGGGGGGSDHGAGGWNAGGGGSGYVTATLVIPATSTNEGDYTHGKIMATSGTNSQNGNTNPIGSTVGTVLQMKVATE